jgi:tRNA threonylcarbamoyladenosine biosynthesis protein TsaB
VTGVQTCALPISHASLITVFIDEVLQNAKKKASELDAVAVSIGPGSYTGLRIGLSCAKGLCYALNIPLITIDSLESLAQGMISEKYDANALYLPLIDARRNEVYYAIFNAKGEALVK